MHTFPAIDWLSDWKRHGVDPLAQRDYVRSELQRVAALGAPVLSMVLLAPFPVQTEMAMSLLMEGALSNYRFYFRLVEGKTPPDRDPQGRDVGKDKRGKVLVAKVGTKGGQIGPGAPEAISGQFSGPAVRRAESLGQDIYQYVEIGREPVEIPISKASIVLRQYGYQIRQPQYVGRSKRIGDDGNPNERDAHGKLVREMDFWLVEEIPPSQIAPDGSVKTPQQSQQNPKRAA
jgi:hypothetical protein